MVDLVTMLQHLTSIDNRQGEDCKYSLCNNRILLPEEQLFVKWNKMIDTLGDNLVGCKEVEPQDMGWPLMDVTL